MARCWRCGTPIGVFRYKCSACEGIEKINGLREEMASKHRELASVFQKNLELLSHEFSNIATILEWGFDEVSWQLEQQTEVLKRIDRTLKTPVQTQANEWRQIAEEMRRRGVLDESEKFFLKSLEANPLDYRTWIGLGKAYLQMGKPDKARAYWGKSLPHAPKKQIDYKSYSYRLIGHLDFCEDNPQKAAQVLKKAVELSPNYYPGHYDYAQYCALIGDKENCLSSLRIAILEEPLPLELVEKERNFDSVKTEVRKLLETIKSDENLLLYQKLKQVGDWAPDLFNAAGKEVAESKKLILSILSVLQDKQKAKKSSYHLYKLYEQKRRELEKTKDVAQRTELAKELHEIDRVRCLVGYDKTSLERQERVYSENLGSLEFNFNWAKRLINNIETYLDPRWRENPDAVQAQNFVKQVMRNRYPYSRPEWRENVREQIKEFLASARLQADYSKKEIMLIRKWLMNGGCLILL
jgi:tetratricopeptide (TPR) repeat protein